MGAYLGVENAGVENASMESHKNKILLGFSGCYSDTVNTM